MGVGRANWGVLGKKSLRNDMKITTLDKLIDEIKDCMFYRITFGNTSSNSGPIWIIGERKSYLEKIEDPQYPGNFCYIAHLSVRQSFSIELPDPDDEDDIAIGLKIAPKIYSYNMVRAQEEGNYFFSIKEANRYHIVDFKKFNTSTEFFRNILRNLNEALKRQYGKSLNNVILGKCGEELCKEVDYRYFVVAACESSTSGIGISCRINNVPTPQPTYIYFYELDTEDLNELSKEGTSISIKDLKNKILELIKSAMLTSICLNYHKQTIVKNGKWLKNRIK